MTPRIPADAIKVSVSVQREATDRRGSSGGAAAADEAQPPTPLAYNVPSADLLAELKVLSCQDIEGKHPKEIQREN